MRTSAKITLLVLCLQSLSLVASAMQVRDHALRNDRLFGIHFGGENMSFYGRHDRINAISLQEYQAGPYIVTEVVIDLAQNPSQLRLYHTQLMDFGEVRGRVPPGSGIENRELPEPVQRLVDRGRDLADTVRGQRVVKDYPHATHARTLEYRLSDRSELIQFYRAFVQRFAGPVDQDDPGEGLRGTVFTLSP